MLDDLVIGAGLAGLATAWHLVEQGREVAVFEAGARAGGLIRTVVEGGLVLELGPQSLQSTPAAVRLAARLGLRARVLVPEGVAHARFVLHEGRLEQLPRSISGLWRSPLLRRRQVLRLLAEPLVPRGGKQGETLFDFVARRFGVGVAEGLLDPFVAGVFGGDPRELEACTAFAVLVDYEREHGSVVRGALAAGATRAAARPPWMRSAIFAFRGGNGGLVDALVQRLGPRLHLGQAVRNWQVFPGGFEVPELGVSARRLWVCCPPHQLGLLPALQQRPVVSVHLAWPREQVARGPGFGWLAPSHERTDVLGALWVSSLFPSHAPGRRLVRVMMGGTRDPEAASLSDAALVARARAILAEVEGVTAVPSHVHLHRAMPGIPQYRPGHGAALSRLANENPGVGFVGWHVSGVGLSHILAAAEDLTAHGSTAADG